MHVLHVIYGLNNPYSNNLTLTIEFSQILDNKLSKPCRPSLLKANMLWDRDNPLLPILEAIYFEIVFD